MMNLCVFFELEIYMKLDRLIIYILIFREKKVRYLKRKQNKNKK